MPGFKASEARGKHGRWTKGDRSEAIRNIFRALYHADVDDETSTAQKLAIAHRIVDGGKFSRKRLAKAQERKKYRDKIRAALKASQSH